MHDIQIVDETGISRTTVSRMITQWEAAGQIEEFLHPKDGRRRILGFTEEATGLNEEWSKKVMALVEENFEARAGAAREVEKASS